MHSDVLPAGKTASRDREILLVTTSKIFVTKTGLEINGGNKTSSWPSPLPCVPKTDLKILGITSLFRRVYGAYGVTVNTGACGALNSGSIPDRHPVD